MMWKDVKKGDKVWVNGKEGEIRFVSKTYTDDKLEEVYISTWVKTNELLIGRYQGPTVQFYTPKEDQKEYASEWFLSVNLEENYDSENPIVGKTLVVSLTEQSGEEALRAIKEREKESRRNLLSQAIIEEEKNIEEIREKILEFKKELETIDSE